MNITKIIDALVITGERLHAFLYNKPAPEGFDFTERINKKINEASTVNPWFTEENIKKSLKVWSNSLKEINIYTWLERYPEILNGPTRSKRKVAVIMAGNIPLAGFHDFLCVLLAGHKVIAKMSTDDSVLLPLLGEMLIDAEPEIKDIIITTTEQIKDFDAIIATGSNNTSRYFEYYFSKYPNIIRKNRNSLAVLEGTESFSNLDDLCSDIFDYFGMGCRSVSKLFVPKGYDFSALGLLLDAYGSIGDHHKYRNNYDYRKSIFLINKVPFLDYKNILLIKNSSLQSPLAVLHYEEYNSIDDAAQTIESDKMHIQCVVCNSDISDKAVPFGKAQEPRLWDYADGVDTIRFLLSI